MPKQRTVVGSSINQLPVLAGVKRGGMMRKHGISVREKKSNKLVRFIECETGREALKVLGGIRINMSSKFMASEEFLPEEEINKIAEA